MEHYAKMIAQVPPSFSSALTAYSMVTSLFPNFLNSEIQVNLSYQGFKEWVIRDSYVHNSWGITYLTYLSHSERKQSYLVKK